MITRKEMGYIYGNGRKPFPGEDYCQKILSKLKKCFDLYNNEYLNKKYTIQFSNNEEVDFEILEKNLAHLLGIDYKYLLNYEFEDYRKNVLGIDSAYLTSYLVLESIIKNAENVIEYDKENSAYDPINYYKVGIKCDIFSKLADLSGFHYGCINLDKATYDNTNPDKSFTAQSSKLLFTPSDEVLYPYFMMGLKPAYTVPDNHYIAETLFAPETPARFFNGQEVIIPTQVLTDDNGILEKRIATPAEKIKLIREYQNILNEYNINDKLNIFGDYFSLLMSNKGEETQLKLKK